MLMLVASAGAADGMAAFVAKIVAQDASEGALLAVVAWAALVAAVVLIGVMSESTALQRFAATRVAPTVLVMQIVIPVVLAPLVGGEGWSDTPLGGGVLAAALVAIAVGAALLASSPAVARLAVGEAQERGGGGGKCGEGVAGIGLRRQSASHRRPELGAGFGDLRQAEAQKRLVVDPDVAQAPPVGDDAAAAHDRLQHGQPGGGVNEQIRRPEPLRHALAEPFDQEPGL